MDKFKELIADSKTRLYVTIAVVVIVLVIVVVLICTTGKVADKITDKTAEQQLIAEANANIVASEITLTQSQFETYADKLYRAMKGWGTNETAIFNTFEAMSTRSDIMQLIKTFGIKDSMNLKEWLYDDLSESDISRINSILYAGLDKKQKSELIAAWKTAWDGFIDRVCGEKTPGLIPSAF